MLLHSQTRLRIGREFRHHITALGLEILPHFQTRRERVTQIAQFTCCDTQALYQFGLAEQSVLRAFLIPLVGHVCFGRPLSVVSFLSGMCSSDCPLPLVFLFFFLCLSLFSCLSFFLRLWPSSEPRHGLRRAAPIVGSCRRRCGKIEQERCRCLCVCRIGGGRREVSALPFAMGAVPTT
jgi:hypothetical protein